MSSPCFLSASVTALSAVNPLVAALSIDNDVCRGYVADTLGRLGYPQALPYLKRLAEDPKANAAVRQTAAEAIRQVGGLLVAAGAPVDELLRELWPGLAPGDLVFFATPEDHVGIYLGNNLFIHASSKGRKVTINSLETPYYLKRFIGGKRLLTQDGPDTDQKD